MRAYVNVHDDSHLKHKHKKRIYAQSIRYLTCQLAMVSPSNK